MSGGGKQIKRCRVESFFDAVVISSIDNASKPNRVAYQLIQKRLHIQKPEETLFVDDNVKYVKGASRYGFKSLLVDREGDLPEAEFLTIRDLRELYRFLDHSYDSKTGLGGFENGI